MATANNWSKLASIPKGAHYGCATGINQHEFIIASATSERWGFSVGFDDEQNEDNNKQGIHKYNVTHNQWSKFIEYPNTLNDKYGAANFIIMSRNYIQSQTDKVYMYDNTRTMVLLIKRKNPSIPIFLIFPIYPWLLSIDDNIQIIGGPDYNTHYTGVLANQI